MAVVIEFGSGLGNQLFQFAAAYAVAKKYDDTIVADISTYSYPLVKNGRVCYRPFVLKDLGFPLLVRRPGWPCLYRVRGYPRLRRAVLNLRTTRYSCQGDCTKEFASLPPNVVLSGYFQDLHYFRAEVDEIANVVRDRLEAACVGKWEPLPKNVAAVHFRLGDYRNHPEFYPDWFATYTPKVARELLDRYDIDRVLVFTDDAQAAAAYVRDLGPRIAVADSNPLYQGSADLLRMASASVLAIANSSFSWWSGLLAARKGGDVIAPERWSTWCSNPRSKLYPDGWTVCAERGERTYEKILDPGSP